MKLFMSNKKMPFLLLARHPWPCCLQKPPPHPHNFPPHLCALFHTTASMTLLNQKSGHIAPLCIDVQWPLNALNCVQGFPRWLSGKEFT